jgi:hypothetical protein
LDPIQAAKLTNTVARIQPPNRMAPFVVVTLDDDVCRFFARLLTVLPGAAAAEEEVDVDDEATAVVEIVAAVA